MRKSQFPWACSRPKIISYKIFTPLCRNFCTWTSLDCSECPASNANIWVNHTDNRKDHSHIAQVQSLCINDQSLWWQCSAGLCYSHSLVEPCFPQALFHHLCAHFPELGSLEELFVSVVLATASLTLQLAPYPICVLTVQSWSKLWCTVTSPIGAIATLL